MFDKTLNEEQLKEFSRYVIAGLLILAFSFSVNKILLNFLDYRSCYLIVLLISESYAYFLNKLYVFESHVEDRIALFSEVVRFFMARGVIEIFNKIGLMAVVEIVHLDPVSSKYLIQAAAFLLAYLIRKNFVFVDNDN